MSAAPPYCRYGVHGDVTRSTNIDGTVIYRTRERVCDCPPPPPPPPQSTPSRRTMVVGPPPRRAAGVTARPRRRVSGSGINSVTPSRNGHRGSGVQTATVVATADGFTTTPAAGLLRTPLDFYAGGLRVVVPPLTPAVVKDDANGVGVLPALPSIPVVWPHSYLPELKDTHTAPYSIASLSTGAGLLDANPLVTAATAAAPLPPPAAAAAAVEQTQPALAAMPLAAAGEEQKMKEEVVVCSAEQHDMHRRWGIAFCAHCGLRLSDAAGGVGCCPSTCPLGPHTHTATAATSADGGKASEKAYCMLCGTSLKNCFAATATAADHVPHAPRESESGGPQQEMPLPLNGDFLTRKDLQSVDEIMAHLLHNAHTHGGKLQPPCGLPHCRLCEGATAAGNADTAGGTGGKRVHRGDSPWDKWGNGAVMCGSPAVAIIHNHYYR